MRVEGILTLKGVLTLAAAAAFCAALGGCRFKAPSVAESNRLVSGNYFPQSVPAWINQRSSTAPRPATTGGVAPSTYSVPTNVEISRQAIPSGNSALRRETETAVDRARLGEEADFGAGASKKGARGGESRVDTSPLDRIAAICPRIETQVNDALTTTELAERINKYEALTARCSESPDLWLWLGKDYQASGNHVGAVRAFEKVTVLDPGNEVGAALLAVSKKKIQDQREEKK